MIIVRPITLSDYEELHGIAIESGHGFTSLPVNHTILTERIEKAIESFNKVTKQPGDESYLLVMEDTKTNTIIGTSGIDSAVGLEDAFYHYHLGKVVHHSRTLNIYNTVETLTLCNDYTGSAEICTLFLSKEYRKNKNGSLLSRSRFLFMAEHRERFSNTVIAEMRGVSDKHGRSPFWSWLEEHFFSMDFPTADYLSGIGKKGFIAELMPKYPIYVSLLNKDAQAAINQVHEETAPALHLLELEGFSSRGYVDIFDAGPTVESKLKEIKTVRHSKKYQVVITPDIPQKSINYLICNDQTLGFRALQILTTPNEIDQTIPIPSDVAKALNVTENDWVRIIKN